ncbi:hypothetical protein [Paracoccus sp. ME4]|uniref:hypothetical protein n=1 Tax=Paracoccus sp. ME4 TaxID=3138066 RepID=UPI00398B547B
MFSEQIETTITVLAAGLALVLIVFSILRKAGRDKASWVALFFMAYPLLTALLLVIQTTWPAEATSAGIMGYTAGKVGALFVIAFLSMGGLLLTKGRIVGMALVLVCLSWITYVTGDDPFLLELPNQLPAILSPILLALFYWLWTTFEGDRIYDWLDQSSPGGFGKLKPRGMATSGRQTNAQGSAPDAARITDAWRAAERTSTEAEGERAPNRSAKAEHGAERSIFRMAVGAAVGAASVYALMMIAAAASANRFSYAMANDPQMMLWPAIAGAVIGAGITTLRR